MWGYTTMLDSNNTHSSLHDMATALSAYSPPAATVRYCPLHGDGSCVGFEPTQTCPVRPKHKVSSGQKCALTKTAMCCEGASHVRTRAGDDYMPAQKSDVLARDPGMINPSHPHSFRIFFNFPHLHVKCGSGPRPMHRRQGILRYCTL